MNSAEKLITENLDIWTSAIKAKSAAGRGKSNKTELYGIKKLRELILGAALAGGFSTDEGEFDRPVADLLKDSRKSYSKSTGRKLKDYKQGDALIAEFDLPPSWPWVRVADLCDLQTGATPSRQKPEYFGGDIRWLVSGDINQGEIDDCEGRITEEGLSASNCKILPARTVLIALNGQGKTRASVAHLNVEATCNQSLVGMIPFDRNLIDSRFLLLALRYRYYEIRDITGQKQRRGLNMGLVAQLSIPLPPIDVQRSIVTKVDELMALCDQLEQQQETSITAHQTLVQTLLDALTNATKHEGFTAAWARIADHFDTLFTTEWSIDQLKQTILQLAVMGKLVPQDPSDEPASELLKKIAAEKAQLVKDGKIKKQKALPPIEGDEKPFELPEGWEWARLGTVGVVASSSRVHKKEWQESGVPFYRAREIVKLSQFGNVENELFITEELFQEHSKSGIVPESDDVMMTGVGTIGVPYVVPEKARFYFKDASVLIFKNFWDLYPQYLYYYMRSPFWIDAIHEGSMGTTVHTLTITRANTALIPVAPIAEQHRIVAKVDELMALCDNLIFQISSTQITQLQLADALAREALH